MTRQLKWLLVVLALVAVACSGGDRPELAETAATGSDPTPTPESSDDSTADTSAADADDESTSSSDTEDAPPETEAPAGDDAGGDTADDPPPADVAPAPDAATFPGQGTATIALADGRSYEAEVGCSTQTVGDTWEFRFGGTTADDVQIEGAYDTSQPDFVIVFISGPDSLNGDDVLLSNLNGGDDLVQTSSEGSEWIASIRLWSPEGEVVDAELEVTCG